MSGPVAMADTNVARELGSINDRLNHHDIVLETLTQVQVKQAAMTEKLVSTSDRQDEYQKRTDESFARLSTRVDEIQKNQHRWMGGIAALVTVAGLIGVAVNILTKVNS